MIASVLLSICALAHNDETLMFDRLINKDSRTGDALEESSERRRLLPPELGVEGGACRTGFWNSVFFYRCNWGLYCDKYSDGSATYGVCRRYWPARHEETGNEGQVCNPEPESPCNANNLEPRYEFDTCRCQYRLLGSPESSTQAASSVKLGKRAPMFSDLNGVCGKHIGGPDGPDYVCRSGLKCKQYYSAGALSGVCVEDTPQTHYSDKNGVCGKHIGGPDGPDYVCRSGLKCKQYYSAGALSGICVDDTPKTHTSGLNGVCGKHIGGPEGPDYVCRSGLKCKQYYSAGALSGICVDDTPKVHTSGLNGVCGKHIGGPDGPTYVCDQGLECRQYYSAGTWAGICDYRLYGQAPGN